MEHEPRVGQKNPALQSWIGHSIAGPYPAPLGYHWEYVAVNGAMLTHRGQRVVVLKAN